LGQKREGVFIKGENGRAFRLSSIKTKAAKRIIRSLTYFVTIFSLTAKKYREIAEGMASRPVINGNRLTLPFNLSTMAATEKIIQ
jgi:hypothetical protein